MKIITWNMDYWKRSTEQRINAWNYLIEYIDPDIALIQEIVPPDNTSNNYHTIYHKIEYRKWGTAIISKHPIIKELYFNNCYPGSSGLIACEINIADDFVLTLINIYGQIDENGYASTTMHHLLSDLTPIFDKKNKRNIILGGDFNVSEQYDGKYKGENPSHKLIFDRLEDFGLVNCTYKFFNSHVQTHVHGRSEFEWQNDYLFVTENISDKVSSCEVINQEGMLAFSDHYPVVIEVEIKE